MHSLARPLHHHGPSLAEVVFGRKRWFVVPPSTSISFNPTVSTLTWYHSHLQRGGLPKGMWQCSQQPGEVLYLPGNWWHATLNVGETVFFLNFVEMADLANHQHSLLNGASFPS